MTENLILPGTFPELLRWCSPVIAVRKTHTGTPKGQRGVALGLKRKAVYMVGWHGDIGRLDPEFSGYHAAPAQQSCIALDLTVATGRAHAAWWLLGRKLPIRLAVCVENALGLWVQPSWTDEDRAVFWSSVRLWTCVSHLDPNDPRLLPDGSRWVDAEALRLICLHVHIHVADMEGYDEH